MIAASTTCLAVNRLSASVHLDFPGSQMTNRQGQHLNLFSERGVYIAAEPISDSYVNTTNNGRIEH